MADVLQADDSDATTLAPMHEVEAGLRRLVEEAFRARSGRGETRTTPTPLTTHARRP
jgi:hypothetical protein